MLWFQNTHTQAQKVFSKTVFNCYSLRVLLLCKTSVGSAYLFNFFLFASSFAYTHTKTESPHGAVYSLYFRTSYWQDLSKVLNPGHAVESHTFTGKTTSFAREEESTSLCCKLSGIKCHSTL